ncbi:hypothetical protein F2P56_026890 [Juglans regia]|uniref:Two-component response regulator-like APRR9 isoform X1 n=2 Tax=Juglans regia TaxID=51240 RepID=A0A2I4DPB1_JUGRE|nr:two-component response regulator-like APRR9 isoform X1 [Juglans regia]KAF5451823.1 hypothetical protein F2P56_026890 [Juglans regia]
MDMERQDDHHLKEDGTGEVVRWERLRVLLVEPDDSTRQIIAALLRKCSYRVAAVADGLKAWETLKGRPHNIDLILTEVESPSISGFALLTLVMGHDCCKNIPVIMMSSHDSINMVLKCMLKGAADFLIKPVRKNELRNLWQHAWRRHTLTGGHFPQNLTVPLQKDEASSENNAGSNNSSDCVASTHRNIECSEKGSDSQSSCTTLYLEAESAYMQNMQGPSENNSGGASNLRNIIMEKQGGYAKLDEESVMPGSQDEEKSNRLSSEVALYRAASNSTALRLEEDTACAESITQNDGVRVERGRCNTNIASKTHSCNNELVEPSSGAIDLIGTFDNHPKCTYENTNYNGVGTNKFELVPNLQLSLRRTCSSSSNNHWTEERPLLNHSNASPFSWYNCSTTLSRNCTNLEEGGSMSHELSSYQISGSINGTFLQQGHENSITSVIDQSREGEPKFSSHQVGIIPVSGVNDANSGYSHVFPPMFYTRSDLPSVPKLACQRDQSPFPSSTSVQSNPETQNSEQGYHFSDEISKSSVHQAMQEDKNLEQMEELGHGSAAADQTTGSSLCNGAVDNRKRVAYGSSSSRRDEFATGSESWNESSLSIHDGSRGMDALRSSQREAALIKFRLKRKDRCYEKKVRYHSRKRLAEQRPRVKGQFVRKVQTDPLVGDTDVCI